MARPPQPPSFLRNVLQSGYMALSTCWTMTLRRLPAPISERLKITVSIFHQLLNLFIGRLLPDLTQHIPNTDLSGKNIIVTGSSSGIGLQIALDLARRGANVVLACRNLDRGESARLHIVRNCPEADSRIKVLKVDTSDLDSVRAFTVSWLKLQEDLVPREERPGVVEKRLDVLVHNAGISHAPPGKAMTEDGLDVVYATNFLGSFLLTYLLEPYLSPTGRVVFTSSTGQLAANFKKDFAPGPVRGGTEPGFHNSISQVPFLGWEYTSDTPGARYSMTKGMQCIFARCLQRRFDRQVVASSREVKSHDGETVEIIKGRGKRTAHSFTPDFTYTPIFAKFSDSGTGWVSDLRRDPVFMLLKMQTGISVEVAQGAATGVWLACTDDPAVLNIGGGHWDRMCREFSIADKMRPDVLDRFWRRWEQDCGIEWS